MLGGFLEARTGATLGLAPPLPNRDWDSKDGQTVTMTFSERPAPAVVTTPATETLPVAPPGTARTLCTNEPSPEGQSFSPGGGSGGGGCAAYRNGGRSPLRCPCSWRWRRSVLAWRGSSSGMSGWSRRRLTPRLVCTDSFDGGFSSLRLFAAVQMSGAQHQSSLEKPATFLASSRSLTMLTNSFLRAAASRISMSSL